MSLKLLYRLQDTCLPSLSSLVGPTILALRLSFPFVVSRAALFYQSLPVCFSLTPK